MFNASRRSLLTAVSCATALSLIPTSLLASDTTSALSFMSDGTRQPVKIPVNPTRLFVNDLSVLDTLTTWNLTDRIVAGANPASLDYLQLTTSKFDIIKGGLKSPSLELIQSTKPDLVFISSRLSAQMNNISKLAPTLMLAPNYAYGALKSYIDNLLVLGEIFGQQTKAQAEIADVQKRISAIASKAKGQRAAVLMINAGRIMMLPPKGRCSLITDEMGFTNVVPPRKGPAPKKKATTPMDDAAKRVANDETMAKLLEANPEVIFILNKDVGVSRPNPTKLDDVINAQWNQLSAVKNKGIITLTANAWYLGEGGIQSMRHMITDIESIL